MTRPAHRRRRRRVSVDIAIVYVTVVLSWAAVAGAFIR
jgi:hypothetical protein